MQIRIEVRREDARWSKRIGGSFESGATRSLGARLGGFLGKELTVWWND